MVDKFSSAVAKFVITTSLRTVLSSSSRSCFLIASTLIPGYIDTRLLLQVPQSCHGFTQSLNSFLQGYVTSVKRNGETDKDILESVIKFVWNLIVRIVLCIVNCNSVFRLSFMYFFTSGKSQKRLLINSAHQGRNCRKGETSSSASSRFFHLLLCHSLDIIPIRAVHISRKKLESRGERQQGLSCDELPIWFHQPAGRKQYVDFWFLPLSSIHISVWEKC